MAADLHIHVVTEGAEGEDGVVSAPAYPDQWDPSSVARSPNVWVGEVSWLKADLFGSEDYVPAPVQAVFDLIGDELPVVDDALIEGVVRAMGLPNATRYSLAEVDEVRAFLEAHRGLRAFTVSW